MDRLVAADLCEENGLTGPADMLRWSRELTRYYGQDPVDVIETLLKDLEPDGRIIVDTAELRDILQTFLRWLVDTMEDPDEAWLAVNELRQLCGEKSRRQPQPSWL